VVRRTPKEGTTGATRKGAQGGGTTSDHSERGDGGGAGTARQRRMPAQEECGPKDDRQGGRGRTLTARCGSRGAAERTDVSEEGSGAGASEVSSEAEVHEASAGGSAGYYSYDCAVAQPERNVSSVKEGNERM